MQKQNGLFLTVLLAGLACLLAFGKKEETLQASLTGAWQQQEEGAEDVLLFMDGYCTQTRYRQGQKQFVLTRGGTYTTQNNNLNLTLEFDTQNKELIGQSLNAQYEIKGNELTITLHGERETWKRVDDGKAPLAGVWRITDRMQEGKLTPIHQTGTRKTVKILTGTRFQWAAIDPGEKSFSGTGGGTYTFANGKYTENIEFFSRDSARVGASLTFDDKLEEGKWHHTGLSSRGDAIYEVWSRIK